MDDAARRAQEIVAQIFACIDVNFRFFHVEYHDVKAVEIVAAALREMEADLEAERTMRILLAKDSQRHLEAYIERGERLAEVEEELHKWQDKATERQEQLAFLVGEKKTLATRLARVEAALSPTAIWTVNGKDRLLHAIDGDGLSHGDLSRIVTNALRALTPDATTEGT